MTIHPANNYVISFQNLCLGTLSEFLHVILGKKKCKAAVLMVRNLRRYKVTKRQLQSIM